MKTLIISFVTAMILLSCGNANDGDANTDTTTLSIDTGGLNNPNDTANHVNTNTGTYPKDSLMPGKTDVKTPNTSTPGSTTPVYDSAKKKY
jgi:hypothetical protein